MPVNAEDLVGKTDSEIKAMLADRARKNGLRGVADAIQKPSAKSVDVPKQTGDGKGVRVEDQAGDQAAGKGEALKATAKKQEPAIQTVKDKLVDTYHRRFRKSG
jgi:hypothetical protein